MEAQPAAISWNANLDTALHKARTEHRDVLLDFTAAPM
jgi:hypothetical protein